MPRLAQPITIYDTNFSLMRYSLILIKRKIVLLTNSLSLQNAVPTHVRQMQAYNGKL